jgi:hypothetical protein
MMSRDIFTVKVDLAAAVAKVNTLRAELIHVSIVAYVAVVNMTEKTCVVYPISSEVSVKVSKYSASWCGDTEEVSLEPSNPDEMGFELELDGDAADYVRGYLFKASESESSVRRWAERRIQRGY